MSTICLSSHPLLGIFSPSSVCCEHRCYETSYTSICLNSCFQFFGYLTPRSGIAESYGDSTCNILRNPVFKKPGRLMSERGKRLALSSHETVDVDRFPHHHPYPLSPPVQSHQPQPSIPDSFWLVKDGLVIQLSPIHVVLSPFAQISETNIFQFRVVLLAGWAFWALVVSLLPRGENPHGLNLSGIASLWPGRSVLSVMCWSSTPNLWSLRARLVN